jgi:hypothetical protein
VLPLVALVQLLVVVSVARPWRSQDLRDMVNWSPRPSSPLPTSAALAFPQRTALPVVVPRLPFHPLLSLPCRCYSSHVPRAEAAQVPQAVLGASPYQELAERLRSGVRLVRQTPSLQWAQSDRLFVLLSSALRPC